MDAEDRWFLYDFAAGQIFCDFATALYQRVYGGATALFDDGPFELAFVDDSPVLLGVGGDGAGEVRHVMESPVTTRLTETGSTGEEGAEVEVCTQPPDASAPAVRQLLFDLRNEHASFAFSLPCDGSAFKAEWVHYKLPSFCGVKPVSLFVGLSWVVPFLWAEEHEAPKRYKLYNWIYGWVAHDFPDAPFEVLLDRSKRSRVSEYKKKGVRHADDELEGANDWLVSVPTLVLFLSKLFTAPRKEFAVNERVSRRCRALLDALLTWPLDFLDARSAALPLSTGAFLVLADAKVHLEACQETESDALSRIRRRGGVLKGTLALEYRPFIFFASFIRRPHSHIRPFISPSYMCF